MIEVQYKNFVAWWLRSPSYVYKFSVVKGSEYKTHSTIYKSFPDSRTGGWVGGGSGGVHPTLLITVVVEGAWLRMVVFSWVPGWLQW